MPRSTEESGEGSRRQASFELVFEVPQTGGKCSISST
jgi:hypothetical protein